MKVSRTAVLLAALSLTSAAGCVHPSAKKTPDAPTWVRVENQALSDATIYVWESSSRRRLGRVGSLSNETLLIPSSMVFGATPLRFQLDFLAGNRTPLTESITVVPGDTVILQIPPQ
jgi:hypothetical protein